DPETGLHYNRFRYYSPELGRFLQSDPLGTAGGVNLYAYCANPLTAVDLDGLTEHPNQRKVGDAANPDPVPSTERPTKPMAAVQPPRSERTTAPMPAVKPPTMTPRGRGEPKTNGVPKSALRPGDLVFGLYNKQPTMSQHVAGTGAKTVVDLPNPP